MRTTPRRPSSRSTLAALRSPRSAACSYVAPERTTRRQRVAFCRRSIIELCHADHRGDGSTLSQWLANKTADNMRRWIASREPRSGRGGRGPHCWRRLVERNGQDRVELRLPGCPLPRRKQGIAGGYGGQGRRARCRRVHAGEHDHSSPILSGSGVARERTPGTRLRHHHVLPDGKAGSRVGETLSGAAAHAGIAVSTRRAQ